MHPNFMYHLPNSDLPYFKKSYAICLHFDVSEFQKKPISSRVVQLVVVPKTTAPASNEAPSVNGTVHVPVIDIRSVSQSTGVPLIVNQVIVAVWFVICTTLYRSVFIAGVAEFADNASTLA